MHSLVILALVVGCSRDSAPTRKWCQSYVNELRMRAAGNIHAMTLNEANRESGSRELLAMVGSDPALGVSLEVCSDASGDSPAVFEARAARVIELQSKISNAVLSRTRALDEAGAKQLGELFDQLALAYLDAEPRRP